MDFYCKLGESARLHGRSHRAYAGLKRTSALPMVWWPSIWGKAQSWIVTALSWGSTRALWPQWLKTSLLVRLSNVCPPSQPTPHNTVFSLSFDTHLLTFSMSIPSTESTKSTPEPEAATTVTKLSSHELEPVTTIAKCPNKGKFDKGEVDFLQNISTSTWLQSLPTKRKVPRRLGSKRMYIISISRSSKQMDQKVPILLRCWRYSGKLIHLSGFEYWALFSDNCALVQQQSDCQPRTRI